MRNGASSPPWAPQKKSQRNLSARDIALAIAVMVIWGAHYAVIRIGALEIPPFLLLTIRFALCAALFLPFAKRISIPDFKNILLYAIPFQGIHMATLFIGLAQVDASIGTLIMKAGVPFSIIIGWVIFNERFGFKTFFGIIIAISGGVLMLYNPHENTNITFWGITFLFISALFWSIGSARLKYIKDLDFATMIGYAFLSALPLAIIATLAFETNHLQALKDANIQTLTIVLAFQVLLVSLSHYWWKTVMSRNPAYLVTPYSLLTPIFGVAFGVWLLDERLSTTTIIGAAVALAGIAIVTLRKAQRERKAVS